MIRRRWLAPLALLLVLGPRPVLAQVDTTGLLPPGFGTLSIDDITLQFTTDELDIRLVPLDERVLRLAKPSVDSSMDQLVTQFRSRIQEASARNGISSPGLALVTFYSRQPNARYAPEDLSVLSPGREYRPVVMIPFSANFNNGQLDLRQRATAIYLFEDPLPVETNFGIRYGVNSFPDAWAGIRLRLDREKARVIARSGLQAAKSTPDSAKSK